MEDGPEVEAAAAAVTAALADHRMEEDSTVVDFIHGRRYGIPFLSVMKAGLIPLYQLSYSLLSLLLHLEVFRHQNHLQQKTYQKAHRTGNDWNPV